MWKVSGVMWDQGISKKKGSVKNRGETSGLVWLRDGTLIANIQTADQQSGHRMAIVFKSTSKRPKPLRKHLSNNPNSNSKTLDALY